MTFNPVISSAEWCFGSLAQSQERSLGTGSSQEWKEHNWNTVEQGVKINKQTVEKKPHYYYIIMHWCAIKPKCCKNVKEAQVINVWKRQEQRFI